MSPPKAGESSKSSAANTGFSLRKALRRHARRLLLTVVACGAVGGGAYAIWQSVAPDVLRHDQFRLSVEQLTITPPPAWIRSDVRKQAFASGGFDEGVWLHDPKLAERIAKTFELHPWVARVERVSLRGTRVQVDLVYRKPVCMVEVVPGGVYPIDVEGVLLPRGDFTEDEAREYPRLVGITNVPRHWEVGYPWADLHVVGGAEIAAALGDCWQALRLDHIAPVASAAPDTIFELVPRGTSSRGKDRIIWGHAPNTPHKGEPSTEQKIAQLKQFLADAPSTGGSRGPRELDLRQAAPPHTAMNPDRDSNSSEPR